MRAHITVELPKGRYVWRVQAVAETPRPHIEALQIIGPVIFSNGKRSKRVRRKTKV
jgi:hypothetical protein